MKQVENRGKIDKSRFEEAAFLLKAMASEIKLCIVLLLSDTDEKTVSEMLEYIDCEQSLLSYHLTDLRDKGILHCRRSGKNCYYSINDKRVTRILSCLLDCK